MHFEYEQIYSQNILVLKWQILVFMTNLGMNRLLPLLTKTQMNLLSQNHSIQIAI